MNSAKGQRILVVDDEENFLLLLSHTLGKEGYQVRTAGAGGDALRCLEREPFDLALIDLRMPEMDGVELLESIRGRYPEMKVILITGYPSAESRKTCHERGVYRYLVKPIEIPELKDTVRLALASLDNPLGKE